MPDDLFSEFKRGKHANHVGEHALQYFIPPEEIRRSKSLHFDQKNPDGKVFLGLIDADTIGNTGPERVTVGGLPIGIRPDLHLTTIAGSRAGKGVSALLPNLIYYPGSMLVIDPKGDLAYATAKYRARTQRVYVLDPYATAGGNLGAYQKIVYNPLSVLDSTSPTLLDDAGVIADALVIPSGNDPHWDESAKSFLEAVIMHVATMKEESAFYADNERDLVKVHDLLQLYALAPIEGGKFLLQRHMELNGHPAVVMGCNTFYQRGPGERGSVMSTVRRHIHFLGYDAMREVLRGPSFDLRELKRSPCTVYLSLPASRMGTTSRWLRLLVNLLISAMEEDKTKPLYPVLAVLDEFAILGRMDRVKDAVGQLAGLNLLLWFVLQDLGQLKSVYSESYETFLGNSGVIQAFGNNDNTTLEWLEKRLGQTAILSPSMSSPSWERQTKGGDSGQSWSYASHPLMTAGEIANYFGRHDIHLRQLLIRPTFLPMVLQRAVAYAHPLFKGRFYERQ